MKRVGLIAAVAATVLVFSLRQDIGAATSNSSETYKELNLFGEVFELVRAEYVDEVNDDTLVESAINGMLTSLDPHSNYLNTKNFNDMKVQTRGEFGGLGIEVSMENGLVKVVSPIDDTPAARAGLKARRSDYPSRRRSGAGDDPSRGGREDARPGQQRNQADDPAGREGTRSTSS